MELVWDEGEGVFIFKCGYQDRLFPKKARFRWDPDKKRWWTDDSEKAKILFEYATDSAQERFLELQKKKEGVIEESRATDAVIDIPSPPGLSYFPFQKAGVKYMLGGANTLLADDMGLGKTVQVIGYMNIKKPGKTLIVCPASLRINWKREVTKWLTHDAAISIYNTKLPVADQADKNDILIIGYANLHKVKEYLETQKFDLLVADEVHYAKNYQAQRSKALYGIKADAKLYLTGTPIVNRPAEIYPIITSLGFRMKFMDFMKKYTNAYHNGYGWDFSGARNLEELQERLRSAIMVRRLKKDVLKDLPPKLRQVIVLNQNGNHARIVKEQDVLRKHEDRARELQAAVDLSVAEGNEEGYRAAVEALRSYGMVAFTEISKIRHETAITKIPFAIEHIENVLEKTDKLVVFAHHRDVVEKLYEHFGAKAVKLIGGMTDKQKQESVDRFQTDSSVSVFVGSLLAAGVGLTLTAANIALFIEIDWVPGNMSQAEDRLHRIGQEGNVLIQHLVFDGSIDAYMSQIIVEKQAIIEKALDSEFEVSKLDTSLMGILFKQDEEKKPRKRRTPRMYTDEVKALILQGIRSIAGVCDGAVQDDGMGFNCFDTKIGKSLAQWPRLTDKQAQLAWRLVTTYQGQIPDLYEEIKVKIQGMKVPKVDNNGND